MSSGHGLATCVPNIRPIDFTNLENTRHEKYRLDGDFDVTVKVFDAKTLERDMSDVTVGTKNSKNERRKLD